MEDDPHFNHTSIMFSHFMGGKALPPFIIFKGLSKILENLLKIEGTLMMY